MKTLIIGIGGAGCNEVSKLNQKLKGDFAVVDTDSRNLESLDIDRKLLIGESITNGLGTGSDPETGAKCATQSAGEIEELVKDYEKIYLIAGLGGGTGSGAVPIIARIIKGFGKKVKTIVTLPFSMESPVRQNRAMTALEELRNLCNVYAFKLDDLIRRMPNSTLAEGFEEINNKLVRELNLPERSEAEVIELKKRNMEREIERLKKKIRELEKVKKQ